MKVAYEVVGETQVECSTYKLCNRTYIGKNRPKKIEGKHAKKNIIKLKKKRIQKIVNSNKEEFQVRKNLKVLDK